MTEPMSGSNRRRWLRTTVPLAVTLLLALGVPTDRALAAAAPAATSLLMPTGDHRAGTVRLHLVDPARVDPTSPTHGVREIMAQVWYPATDTHGFPSTPYMPPLAAAHFLASNNVPPTVTL